MQEKTYSMNLIDSAITSLTLDTASYHRKYYELRPFLPYLLLKMDGWFLPLNRDYKPVGLCRQEWVKYEDYSFLSIPEKYIKADPLVENPLDRKQLHFFFYKDGGTPVNRKLALKYIKLVDEVIFQTFRDITGNTE